MTIIDYSEQRALAVWRACLASAFRGTLACTIIGAFTLYSPEAFQRQVAVPAFSYVTAVLIVTDATLGDTLRGCWLALYATVLSVGPAILSQWLIGPKQLSSGITALVVALAAFVVVLPENLHLVAKRIALGQIVLIYVVGYIKKEEVDAVMHPIHVAASTAVGAFACVLALLLPFPRLAIHEVSENFELLAENASDRVQSYVKACCAEDKTAAQSWMCRSKCLAHAGNKFLQNIKRFQGSVQWERIPLKTWKNDAVSEDKLQKLDLHLRGMEIALANSSFPLKLPNDALKDDLHSLEEDLSQKIKKSKRSSQSSSEEIVNPSQSLYSTPTSVSQLPSLFFLFCMKSLSSMYNDATCHDSNSSPKGTKTFTYGLSFRGIWNTKRLMPALKCSLSLGLAVLFGLIYSKPDGYWAGLPVAISLASSREATFKVANEKAQGTVLGTIYGVIGMFLFERFLPIRFFSLIPWFILTSLLRNSKMYGQAGGVSATIGAVLILGRKNFGPPSDFAIARIVETFIGLSCAILVELVMRPTRGATLAKQKLIESFGVLVESVDSFNLHDDRGNLGKKLKSLRQQLNELSSYVGEANVEPNFWFVPFNSNCYGKLLVSLSRILDVLHFGDLALKSLEQMLQDLGVGSCSKDVLVNKIGNDIKLFKDVVGSSIKCFKEVTSMKSLSMLEKRIEEKNITWDLELGKDPNANMIVAICNSKDDNHEKIMSSYLQHSQEVVNGIDSGEDNKNKEAIKSAMVSNLCALGYCLSGLMKETGEIESFVGELIQWENPSSHVNLYEISCKIRALQS